MLYDFVPQFSQAVDQLGETVTATSITSISLSTANTYTGYTQLFASTPYDAYGIYLEYNAVNLATRQPIYSSLELGIGASGSETLLVENINAGNGRYDQTAEMARSMYLPIFIPQGSRLAARGAMSIINSSTIGVRVTLFRVTDYPFNMWLGRTVTAYGSDRTNLKSSVTVAPNATANVWGSWTQITASTTRRHKAFVMQLYPSALSNPSSSYLGVNYQLGIGASGSEHVISHVQRQTQNPETGWFEALRPTQETIIFRDVPQGTRLSARALYGSSGTPINGAVSVYGIS